MVSPDSVNAHRSPDARSSLHTPDSSDALGTSGARDGGVQAVPLQFTPRLKVGAVVVLLLIAVAIAVLVAALGSHGSTVPIDTALPSATESAAATATESVIYVHLLGAVQNPGLYELPEGARAIDVVAAAGGYLKTADRASLNLARFVTDGEQVYVPKEGEVDEGIGPQNTVGGKVNLNTADSTALETLPRVGPAMAARIIAWREANGGFRAIDDLRSVSGFGEKTFAGLRELITI